MKVSRAALKKGGFVVEGGHEQRALRREHFHERLDDRARAALHLAEALQRRMNHHAGSG